MTRTRIEWIAFTAIGIAAGIGLWFIALVVLLMAGLSFYAVHVAAYAALIIWLTAAPLIYIKYKKTNPHATTHRITPLLGGMAFTLAYFAIGTTLWNP